MMMFVLQDEDKDLVFVTSSNHRQHEKRGVHMYQSSSHQEGDGDEEENEEEGEGKGGKGQEQDELGELRFTYHRTAFDISLDEQEEHAWRLPHTDVSDYFNYGFNEPTWRVSESAVNIYRWSWMDNVSIVLR